MRKIIFILLTLILSSSLNAQSLRKVLRQETIKNICVTLTRDSSFKENIYFFGGDDSSKTLDYMVQYGNVPTTFFYVDKSKGERLMLDQDKRLVIFTATDWFVYFDTPQCYILNIKRINRKRIKIKVISGSHNSKYVDIKHKSFKLNMSVDGSTILSIKEVKNKQ